MSNSNGHHYSKFSWRDWSADKALHPCSLAAKGFWIEMLCIMHEGCPVGHLTLGGKPATARQMAANAYCTERDAAKYLAELEDAGVFSRTEDGTIYSRRMVKDAAASAVGREHIAKRWNGAKSTPRPNRDPNSPPIREATSKPKRDPITNSLESESESERRKEEPPKSPKGDLASWFARFWDLYPRKVGHRTAEAAFVAAVNRGNDPATIIAGLQRAKFPPDPQFQPHPTTWLRADRWRDQVDALDPVLRAAGVTEADFDDDPPPGRLLQ